MAETLRNLAVMKYEQVCFKFYPLLVIRFTHCELQVLHTTSFISFITYEPVYEKTNNLVFRPGLTQTRLYSHRRWLEAGNFLFRKQRNCTIHVAKTKALISFAVTAKLICTFVFACADCWFSHAVAHIVNYENL